MEKWRSLLQVGPYQDQNSPPKFFRSQITDGVPVQTYRKPSFMACLFHSGNVFKCCGSGMLEFKVASRFALNSLILGTPC